MFLYKLDFPNGKSYIGITRKSVEERFYQHCKKSNKSIVSKAIHKYGSENVIVITLNKFDNPMDMLNAEILAIKEFNSFYPNGYNMTNGGDGLTGIRMPDDVRKKISKPKKSKENYKKPKSEEHRKKIGIANSKRIISKDTIEKMKKKKSDSHIKKMSISNLERLKKPFYCSNGIRFENITTAVNWLKSIGYTKAARAGIKRCLNTGIQRTAYGFSWKYE